MKITEMIEELNKFKEKNGDVDVVMEDPIYGHVPAEINITLERGSYEVLVEP